MPFALLYITNFTGTLPLTIDLSRFEHDPGEHSVTVMANSTLGEQAEYTHFFNISGDTCLLKQE